MDVYASGVFSLLHLNETLNEMNERTKCLAFADNFTGAGKLQQLRSWWDSIASHGLNIGFYPKARSWFTIKKTIFQSCDQNY